MKIPFEDIYTSVFLFVTEQGSVLFDSGNSPADVREYILPLLDRLHILPDTLLLSHFHTDHSGGLAALCKAFPQARVCTFENTPDGTRLCERFTVLHLPGHTADCIGIYDTENGTLFTADALQQDGISRFPTYIKDKAAYIETLEKIRLLGPKQIVCAHKYSPFGAILTDTVEECIAYCKEKMTSHA